MAAKVSVVIPTYNYGRFVGQAIKGALAQTHPIEEIIVVDDGSNDNTREVVEKFDAPVRYIRQANAGVCAARNNGVEKASGDFIAFLDADDVWLPEKIEKQIAKFGEDAQIGLVHCGMREFDSASGETVYLHAKGNEGWVADDLLLFAESVTVSGSAIVVRRAAFENVSGFDTNLKVGEDWDFCYRLARKFKVGFVPELLVDYRNHGKNTHFNVREMERSMEIFYEKAFQTTDENILGLRRQAYGNFYKVLAGSYFHSKNYADFVKNSFKSLYYEPKTLTHFLAFPARVFKRRNAGKK
jgi:glycosyltransferase involved in cell wall biosynthesis